MPLERNKALKTDIRYPCWRAFLTENISPMEATASDRQSPLNRLAGALAFVRQGVATKETVEQSDSTMEHEPQVEIREVDGQHQLEFMIEDRQLGDIMCRLRKTTTGLRAELVASDTHTERLLQAEAGRLRVQLEERGLKVDGIDVTRA